MKTAITGALSAAAFAFGLSFGGGAAHAASCDADKGPDDLSYAEAGEVYKCLSHDQAYSGWRS
ncbi:MAG: hypothetical protein AAF360_16205 [Pseudomonadota bacterium]